MAGLEIWINPACSKCRAATSALDEAGVDYSVRRYLDEPPTVQELADVLDRLALEPWHIARPKETREAGIDLPKDASHRADWLAAMVAHPQTIQRPILTANDGTTVVGRDPVAIAEAIDAAQR